MVAAAILAAVSASLRNTVLNTRAITGATYRKVLAIVLEVFWFRQENA
jgi:hypothetical protein